MTFYFVDFIRGLHHSMGSRELSSSSANCKQQWRTSRRWECPQQGTWNKERTKGILTPPPLNPLQLLSSSMFGVRKIFACQLDKYKQTISFYSNERLFISNFNSRCFLTSSKNVKECTMKIRFNLLFKYMKFMYYHHIYRCHITLNVTDFRLCWAFWQPEVPSHHVVSLIFEVFNILREILLHRFFNIINNCLQKFVWLTCRT